MTRSKTKKGKIKMKAVKKNEQRGFRVAEPLRAKLEGMVSQGWCEHFPKSGKRSISVRFVPEGETVKVGEI